jgi:hypothetical protein
VIVRARVVILGARLHVSVVHDADGFEEVECSVDRGGVDAGHPGPDAANDRLGGDVTLRADDLRHDRLSLGGHPMSAGTQDVEYVVRVRTWHGERD